MGSALGVAKIAAVRVGLTLDEYRAKVAVGEKWCTACKAWHPRVDFDNDASRGDGLAAICKAVSRLRTKQRHKTGYEAKPRHNPSRPRRGWYVETRDGDKRQARRRVNYLVEQGLIPKPSELSCFDCGSPAHEYDHARGYGSNAHLYVEPVCRSCHHRREWRRRRGR